MIKRTLTIASLATALGLGLAAASPAEATGPLGGIIANGTQLNGIALQGVTLHSIRMGETDEDDADALSGCPETWVCGMNGTQLNGITPGSVTLDGIELKATEVVLNH
jgi:hypothetical protein